MKYGSRRLAAGLSMTSGGIGLGGEDARKGGNGFDRGVGVLDFGDIVRPRDVASAVADRRGRKICLRAARNLTVARSPIPPLPL